MSFTSSASGKFESERLQTRGLDPLILWLCLIIVPISCVELPLNIIWAWYWIAPDSWWVGPYTHPKWIHDDRRCQGATLLMHTSCSGCPSMLLNALWKARLPLHFKILWTTQNILDGFSGVSASHTLQISNTNYLQRYQYCFYCCRFQWGSCTLGWYSSRRLVANTNCDSSDIIWLCTHNCTRDWAILAKTQKVVDVCTLPRQSILDPPGPCSVLGVFLLDTGNPIWLERKSLFLLARGLSHVLTYHCYF